MPIKYLRYLPVLLLCWLVFSVYLTLWYVKLRRAGEKTGVQPHQRYEMRVLVGSAIYSVWTDITLWPSRKERSIDVTSVRYVGQLQIATPGLNLHGNEMDATAGQNVDAMVVDKVVAKVIEFCKQSNIRVKTVHSH